MAAPDNWASAPPCAVPLPLGGPRSCLQPHHHLPHLRHSLRLARAHIMYKAWSVHGLRLARVFSGGHHGGGGPSEGPSEGHHRGREGAQEVASVSCCQGLEEEGVPGDPGDIGEPGLIGVLGRPRCMRRRATGDCAGRLQEAEESTDTGVPAEGGCRGGSAGNSMVRHGAAWGCMV